MENFTFCVVSYKKSHNKSQSLMKVSRYKYVAKTMLNTNESETHLAYKLY